MWVTLLLSANGVSKTEARPREGGPERSERLPRGADARFCGVGSDGTKPPQGGREKLRMYDG